MKKIFTCVFIILTMFALTMNVKADVLENKEYKTIKAHKVYKDKTETVESFYVLNSSKGKVFSMYSGEKFNDNVFTKKTFGEQYVQSINMDEETYEKIKYFAYAGENFTNHLNVYYYLAVQGLIWMQTNLESITYYENGELLDLSIYFDAIESSYNNYNSTPSFSNKEYTVYPGEFITINDTNNVFAQYINTTYVDYGYEPSSAALQNENKLTLLAFSTGIESFDFLSSYRWTNGNSIYQNKDMTIVEAGYLEPKYFSVKVNSEFGKVQINRKDSITNDKELNEYISLKDAVYEIYKDDVLYDVVEINKDNKGITRFLPFGTYKIKEVKSSYGYDVNEDIMEVVIDSELEIIDVYAIPTYREITLNKRYKDIYTSNLLPEANIIFEIYSKNKLYTTIITNKDGFASIKLPFGEYTIKQINTLYGYDYIEDYNFTIDNKRASSNLSFVNNPIITTLGSITINTYENLTNNIINGSVYKIYNDNGYEALYTTINGEKLVISNLEDGIYYIKQVKSTDGYIIDDTILKIEIENGNNVEIAVYNDKFKMPKTSSSSEKRNIVLNGLFTLAVSLSAYLYLRCK